MLRFFRQIRQRLLTENRFSKYLLYALGEILLVVIGILIALQVDSWNDNRIENEAQQKALYKLKQDLEYDVLLFEQLDSTYFKWLDQSNEILNRLRSKSRDRLETLDEYIVGRGSLNYLTLRTITFDEMINTGLFYRITDEQLSKSIVEYYEYANFEIEKLNNDNRDFYSYILLTMEGETGSIITRLIDQENLEFIDWSWLKNPNSPQYKEFETRVAWFRDSLKENQRVLVNLIEKAGLAIREIDRTM